MKQIFYSVFVLFACFACSKDSGMEEEMKSSVGEIVGTIGDKSTGEAVAVVSVSLSPGEEAFITGSDGNFNFQNLEPGEYIVSASKEFYSDGEVKVKVSAGKPTRADMLIERLPAMVTADRNLLDFGSDAGLNVLSFGIVNRSYEDLEWKIEYDCKWIKELRPARGTLKYGKTESVSVLIDRSLLDSENIYNRTVLVVKSSNGGSEVEVRAVGVERVLPVVNTLGVTKIAAMTACLNAEFVDYGVPEYTECGFVYHTEPMPTHEKALGVLPAPSDNGWRYSCELKGLTVGETYYVRAYAKNSVGLVYSSNEVSFTTKPTLPEVTITAVTDIDVASGSAVFHGRILEAGDPVCSECGFVCAASSNPTVDDVKVTASVAGSGAIRIAVSGLPLDKTLYVRAYALNEAGVAYSSRSETFSTNGVLSEVETDEATNVNILAGTATLHGHVVSTGNPGYSERGFVYGTMKEPTIYDNKIIANGAGVKSPFSIYVTDLPKGEDIYVRAYATNRLGTVYGKVIAITPEWMELPVIGVAVQKKDIGYTDWYSADLMCKQSVVGGYIDWRLPTKEELVTIYTERNVIGGFQTIVDAEGYRELYWSSTLMGHKDNKDWYCCVSFVGDGLYVSSVDVDRSIRCVRTLDK